MIADADPAAPTDCACCLPRRGFMRAIAGLGAAGLGTAGLAVGPGVAAAQPADRAPHRGLVIDCHGHYTTEPPAMLAWRRRQIAAINDPAQSPSPTDLKVSDDEVRASVADRQVKLQGERGISLACVGR